MPRTKAIDRPCVVKTTFPESLKAEVDILLYSELEGKVPYGALQEYLIGLVRKDLEERRKGKDNGKA